MTKSPAQQQAESVLERWETAAEGMMTSGGNLQERVAAAAMHLVPLRIEEYPSSVTGAVAQFDALTRDPNEISSIEEHMHGVDDATAAQASQLFVAVLNQLRAIAQRGE